MRFYALPSILTTVILASDAIGATILNGFDPGNSYYQFRLTVTEQVGSLTPINDTLTASGGSLTFDPAGVLLPAADISEISVHFPAVTRSVNLGGFDLVLQVDAVTFTLSGDLGTPLIDGSSSGPNGPFPLTITGGAGSVSVFGDTQVFDLANSYTCHTFPFRCSGPTSYATSFQQIEIGGSRLPFHSGSGSGPRSFVFQFLQPSGTAESQVQVHFDSVFLGQGSSSNRAVFTPEPTTASLLALGLLGLAMRRRG